MMILATDLFEFAYVPSWYEQLYILKKMTLRKII